MEYKDRTMKHAERVKEFVEKLLATGGDTYARQERTEAKNATHTAIDAMQSALDDATKQHDEYYGKWAELTRYATDAEADIRKVKAERNDALAKLAARDAEVERLTKCLKKANDQAERFERAWYLHRDSLEKIQSWANAYPLKVFPEPDMAKAHELLQAGGITLDAVSASNMRHVISGVKEIVEAVLSEEVKGGE